MRDVQIRGIIVSAIAVAILLLMLLIHFKRRPFPLVSNGAALEAKALNAPATSRERNTPPREHADRSVAQSADFRDVFEKRLRPALEEWCKVYGDHVPFRPEDLTPEHLAGQLGRGKYYMYTFVLDGITLGIEDSKEVARFIYLNAPASKKLLELPKGAPPDTSIPIATSTLSQMLKLDSGTDFPPAAVRITPTALSGAMNGGAYVTVGGDPQNIASWKFTMVFGPDGKLAYYHRGIP